MNIFFLIEFPILSRILECVKFQLWHLQIRHCQTRHCPIENPTLPQKYLFYDDASQILVRLNFLFLVYENEGTPLTQRATHLKIFDTEKF